MPPWWLILAWVIIGPMAVVMLMNPQRLWSRPALAWARDHPDDQYTRGWVAAGVLRAVTGLLIVGISTVVWLHHAQATAQPRLPGTDSTEKVTAHPGPPPLVAIAPEMYARHGKGLRVAWRSWAERLGPTEVTRPPREPLGVAVSQPASFESPGRDPYRPQRHGSPRRGPHDVRESNVAAARWELQ